MQVSSEAWVDNVLMRITEVFLVFPSLLFILIFVRVLTLVQELALFIFLESTFRLDLSIVVFVLALFNWPGDARMVRGEFLRVRELEFVEAEKALGANNTRIIFRHILPNILVIDHRGGKLTVAYAILWKQAVSFLGFGDVNTDDLGANTRKQFRVNENSLVGGSFPWNCDSHNGFRI